MATIHATVIEMRAHDREAQRVRITASYDSANIIGALTFDVPAAEAKSYVIGGAVVVSVSPVA